MSRVVCVGVLDGLSLAGCTMWSLSHSCTPAAHTLLLHHRLHHQLHGRELELRAAAEREYGAALARHAARAVDSRAETHLQVRERLLLKSGDERWHACADANGHVAERLVSLPTCLRRWRRWCWRLTRFCCPFYGMSRRCCRCGQGGGGMGRQVGGSDVPFVAGNERLWAGCQPGPAMGGPTGTGTASPARPACTRRPSASMWAGAGAAPCCASCSKPPSGCTETATQRWPRASEGCSWTWGAALPRSCSRDLKR